MGPLDHSPADIIRKMLVNLGLGVTPSYSAAGKYNGSPWPVFAGGEPDTPDSAITVYDTAGVDHGRLMVTGERPEHHGILIRVRSAAHTAGYAKARAIAVALDTDVSFEAATIGSTTYIVWAVTRTTDVLDIGKETNTNRDLFTVNAIVSLRKDT